MKLIIISIVMLLMLFTLAVAQEQATATGRVSLTIEPPAKINNKEPTVSLVILTSVAIFFRFILLRMMVV